MDPVETMCLGPTCQCDSIVREATARWDAHLRPAPGGRRRAGVGRDAGNPINTTMVQTRWRPAPVKLPSWVGRSPGGLSPAACGCTREAPCKGFCAGLLDTPARYTLRDRQLQSPPGFDMTSRFRHAWSRGIASVCQTSFSKYALHDDIDLGLVEAGKLSAAMWDELHAIFGKVGMNDSMSTLLENAAKCWDWAHLAIRKPGREHIHAFQATYALLQPCLQHTYYQIGSIFARVAREWPSVDALCGQYMHLLLRVRTALQAAQHGHEAAGPPVPEEVVDNARKWSAPPKYQVRPVWVHSLTFLCVKAATVRMNCGLSHSSMCKVASIVSSFLKRHPPQAYTRFWAGSALGRPGQGTLTRRSKKRPEFQAAEFEVGDVAVWTRRRLVTVEEVVRSFAAARVTASIVRHPWFSVGNGVGRSRLAWHAARVAHRWLVS